MSFIRWEEKMSVGVQQFDMHHKHLVELINQLYDAMRQGKTNEVLGNIFKELVTYTAMHFKAEEDLMAKHNFPHLKEHQEEHQELVAKALALKENYEMGKLFIGTDTLDFLREWLVLHIQGSDAAYTSFFQTKGVK